MWVIRYPSRSAPGPTDVRYGPKATFQGKCPNGREVPILLQKSAIVSARRLPRFLERLPINRPLEGGSIASADTFCLHWLRRTCIDLWWWPGDKLC
jgi:hypothetical protein